jgi:hypothetical protein
MNFKLLSWSLTFVFAFISSLLFSSSNSLPDPRSDSFDITHIEINLRITPGTNSISGFSELDVSRKISSAKFLIFDLENFIVDSVFFGLNKTPFSTGSNQIKIPVMNFNFPNKIKVFYKGKGGADPGGWGGVYYSGNYVFNLGVGFEVKPHNYGRAWFPCFDNFVERFTTTTIITVPNGFKASAGGLLKSEISSGTNRIFVWENSIQIPSYLVSFAVGPYISLDSKLVTKNGVIPSQIFIAPADTNKLKGSFVNLAKSLEAFEFWYGPYHWPKVGYSMVPFSNGAMEHAMNIAYPASFVNGNISSESLMAHELSHHWWGDLATCSTAEDMWLNEGFASYSEHLFQDYNYGKAAYLNIVRSNRTNVLLQAHVSDKGYRSMVNIPHDYTYGSHVYRKGAFVLHNLRAYVNNDSLLRKGFKLVMDSIHFSHYNTNDLHRLMEKGTGVDLDDYFNDHIYQPGFADFYISNIQKSFSPNGKWSVILKIRQGLRSAPRLYKNVPVEFLFSNGGNNRVERIVCSGLETTWQGQFDFNPEFFWVNPNESLNLASTYSRHDLVLGNLSTSTDRMNIRVNQIGDLGNFIRLEQHLVGPSGNFPSGVRQNTSRFWSITGKTKNAKLSGSISYNGNVGGPDLEVELLKNTEDSLLLMYRSSPNEDWREFLFYRQIKVIAGDKSGMMQLDSIFLGEYCLANGQKTTSANESGGKGKQFNCFPNPIQADEFFIEGDIAEFNGFQKLDVSGVDNQGQNRILSFEKNSNDTLKVTLPPKLESGHLLITISRENRLIGHCKLIKL